MKVFQSQNNIEKKFKRNLEIKAFGQNRLYS